MSRVRSIQSADYVFQRFSLVDITTSDALRYIEISYNHNADYRLPYFSSERLTLTLAGNSDRVLSLVARDMHVHTLIEIVAALGGYRVEMPNLYEVRLTEERRSSPVTLQRLRSAGGVLSVRISNRSWAARHVTTSMPIADVKDGVWYPLSSSSFGNVKFHDYWIAAKGSKTLDFNVRSGANAVVFRLVSKDWGSVSIIELNENEPNNAVEPTPVAVTPPAKAGDAPSTSAAHLER
jgi:hypothetical protein